MELDYPSTEPYITGQWTEYSHSEEDARKELKELELRALKELKEVLRNIVILCWRPGKQQTHLCGSSEMKER